MGLERADRTGLRVVQNTGAPREQVISLDDRRCREQQSSLLGQLTGKPGLFDELVHPALGHDPVASLVSSLIKSGILEPSDDELEMNLSSDANDPFIITAAHLKVEVVSPVAQGAPCPVLDMVTIQQGATELLALLYMPDPETLNPVTNAHFYRKNAPDGEYYAVSPDEVPFWKPEEEASSEHMLWEALRCGACSVEGMSVISVEFFHPEIEDPGGGPGKGAPTPFGRVA